MTKVIPLEKRIKMSAQDRSEELYKLAHEFRGTGMRQIRRETVCEFLRRVLRKR